MVTININERNVKLKLNVFNIIVEVNAKSVIKGDLVSSIFIQNRQTQVALSRAHR